MPPTLTAPVDRPPKVEPPVFRLPRTAVLGPWLLGLAIGIQFMLVGLIFFGPATPSAQDLRRFTEAGLMIYAPEHDLPLYVLGCGFSVGCTLFLVWRWARGRDPEQALRLASSQFLMAIGSTAVFFTILLLAREITPDEAVPGKLALLLCLAVPAATLLVGAIGLEGSPAASRFFKALVGLAEAPSPRGQSRRWHVLADLAMPLLIALLVYIPYPLQLAGKTYLGDEFHHWDFFLMAPAIGYLHGGALGTEVFAQYGVGWPTLHAALGSWWQLSYAHVFQVSLIYGCLYFIGIYVLLRLLVGSPAWAAAGVILTITLHLFHGGDRESIIWSFPSSTPLRHPMDVWFFIAALCYVRTPRALWAVLAGVAVGLAVFFETDTGLYLTVSLGVFWAWHLLGGARPWRDVAVSCVAAMLIAGGLLAVASRGTLVHGAFWSGWMESLLKYGGGIGMLPFTDLSNPILLFFVLMVSAYLFTFTRATISAARGERAGDQTVVGCLAGYGLMTLLIFVGRTHPYNIFHASIAFSLVATYWLALVHRRAAPGEPGRARSLHRLAPIAAFAGALAALVCHDSFQRYPNLLLGPGLLVREGDLRIEAAGVGGLPHSKGRFVRSLITVTDEMRKLTAAGARVAVLDHADPIYYLSSGAKPWFRYSPLLPFLLTKAQVEEVRQKLLSDPPDYVFLSSTESRALGFKEQDARQAIGPVLEEHFTRKSDIGFFAVWKKN